MKQKTLLAHIMKFEQHAHVNIKTLRGNTASLIHALLKEVCGNATLNRITI